MKQTLYKINLSLAAFGLAFTTLVAIPVYAQGGSDDTTSGSGSVATTTSTNSTTETEHSGTSGSSSSTETSDTSGHTSTKTETTETESSSDTTETELHQKGSELVDQLKHEHKDSKTAEQKTKTCENHKHGLETKFATISKNADAFKTRIDDVFQKAQDYQKANNLSPANWDTLVANAVTAQANAAKAITLMQAVSPTVDCTSPSAAQDVATFKVAAQNTRDSLKTYKQAVKAVLQSLLAIKAPETTTSTSTGGNQ